MTKLISPTLESRYMRSFHLWDNKSNELTSFSTNFTFVIDSQGNQDYTDDLAFFLAQNNLVITTDGAMGLPVNAATTVRYEVRSNAWIH
ncbi:hypothetical protein LXL04_017252 [Taraxacum kok-saghyz]